MRLLILLSAMLTGLTGLIAGQPAVACTGEPAAIASAFAVDVEQVGEVSQAQHLPGKVRYAEPASGDGAPVAPVFAPQSHQVDERRIE